MSQHKNHLPPALLALIAAAVLSAASCSSALTSAEESKGQRDYTAAMYFYAEAVSEGQMESYEFKAKLGDIKRTLGKNAFCFHLDMAIKKANDSTAYYLKQGDTAQVGKEVEKSHHLSLARKTGCTESK